ncbi:MAG: sulfotransferase [Gammaproteobacteria bacterium]|nr:sulfotransferase [Gammaproteobacteria bacterium]
MDFPGADQLREQASKAAGGLTDFGTGYEQGLSRVLEEIPRRVPVSEHNIQQLTGILVGILVGRLYSEAGWKRRPDCLSQPIRAPLVVTGIPRSGTTALHKLLSMDPRFQGLEQWLINTPMPRPPRASWERVPEFRAAVEKQNALLDAVPALRVTHEVNADEVDECLNVLAQSFVSHYFAHCIGLPDYDRWLLSQDERASYRRYADNLRLIGADSPQQRWLLKNPGTIARLDALFEVFPDACVIQTHRDPAKCIPSVCGVVWPARSFFNAREIDPATIGPRECELWAWAVERGEQLRAQHPGRYIDVDFRAFQRDPMHEVARIYERIGLSPDADAERTMRQWLAANPQHKHGRHEYTPEQYGLTAESIRRRYAGYIAQHGL